MVCALKLIDGSLSRAVVAFGICTSLLDKVGMPCGQKLDVQNACKRTSCQVAALGNLFMIGVHGSRLEGARLFFMKLAIAP